MQDPIDNSTVYWRVILGKYSNYYILLDFTISLLFYLAVWLRSPHTKKNGQSMTTCAKWHEKVAVCVMSSRDTKIKRTFLGSCLGLLAKQYEKNPSYRHTRVYDYMVPWDPRALGLKTCHLRHVFSGYKNQTNIARKLSRVVGETIREKSELQTHTCLQ